jgi:ligand-binding sensor domain-containing protein
LLTDHNDNVYIGTLEGLFFLNRKTGKAEALQVPGTKRELPANNAITDLAIDATGTIWITTYNGLWSYDENKDQYTHEIDAQNDSLFTGLFTCLLIDHSGKIWMGTWDKGLKRYDPDFKTISTFSVKHTQDILMK